MVTGLTFFFLESNESRTVHKYKFKDLLLQKE